MSPRVPFFFVVALVAGAVFATQVEGSRPTIAAAPDPVPGLAAPVARTEALSSTWYCAGGTAHDGGMADHTVVVANPTATELGGVLTMYPGRVQGRPPVDSVPVERPFTVPAHDQVSFRLATLRSAPLASALVEMEGGGAVVEHRVVGPHGEDVGPCASGAASSWHFAWGTTSRDAREMLVLFNPFPSDVTVDATFSTEAGVREPLRWQGLTVPARSVVGVDVADDVTRHGQVAASVRARGGRLVVDRIQVLDGSVGPEGLSVTLGQPTGAEEWVFAQGRVDQRSAEQIVLYNPGEKSAEVGVSVQGSDASQATPQPFGVVVRPGRFEIVDYGAEARVPRDVAHSTVVRSRNGVPVVAERVLAVDGGLSAGPGALFGSSSWGFPSIGATPERVVSFAVANPDVDRATRVSLTVYGDGRQTQPGALQSVEVPAGGRVELAVPVAGLPAGAGGVVEAEAPVVVERTFVERGLAVEATPGIPMGDDVHPLL